MKNLISKKTSADHDIERLIGLQLRFGVITASLIVLIGGLIYLKQFGAQAVPHYHLFIGTKAGYTSLDEIFKGAYTVNAKGIVELGVVALIITPILRIAFSLVGFIIEKDKLYTWITFTVLVIMMTSIFGGLKI
ncbi:DUF1634 domain-containing protein [Mucilaginibacter sp. BJC16-A38]|uniref:DUF1634 domain-containing protein n=1 Tax=Mucilaginibacter phenanthrenivorans TaxID=1234842 RepID=UPI0021588FD0|nr:DUF1634 domain-containing protein [Mucilaginibacter phenanthrenivorans]MCR8561351.1 DUF1634 domain-containing protein [Mucilaginibacter phenanthrenivorans]